MAALNDTAPLKGGMLWLVAVMLAMANFIAVLDMTIANVSVPNIAGALGATTSQGTWVITSYAVAEAITVPLTGWLAARFGGDSLVTDTDPDDAEVAQAVAAAQGHSSIVLGSYNGCTRPGQQKLLHALAALGIPMVCVALRNPDDLAELPDHIYGLAVYEYTLSSLEIAAEVLSGALKPTGRLPVTLEEKA
mgnify:CR=1 FL=1